MDHNGDRDETEIYWYFVLTLFVALRTYQQSY